MAENNPTADQAGIDITQMRRHYQSYELKKEDLHADPVVQFEIWFHEAYQANLTDPNAFTLSTVDPNGWPASRTMLLRGYNHQGFVFYTNYQSPKAQHITANPKVALLFCWLPLQRQVRITGIAARISVEESAAYFKTRPVGHQISAWASAQSTIIPNRATFEQQVATVQQRFANGVIPLPDHWGGYRIKPQAFEFWQGQPNRLHDRFQYLSKEKSSWLIQRLSP